MNGEKDQNVLLERLRAYQNKEHERNRKRIKYGFRSMLIVPLVFLVLMFMSDLTGTSKLIMLIVWIISMLVIAGYLIVVEYVDHKTVHLMEPEEPEDGNEAKEREETA